MAGTAVRKAKKSSIDAAYYIAGGAIVFLGIVYLSIAGFEMLQVRYEVPMAATITALVLICLGGIVIVSANIWRNKKKIAPKHTFDNGFLDGLEQSVKSMIDGLEEPVRDNPKIALLLAALAGFAAGDQISDKIRH
jgi:hypothetical protein